MSEHRSILEKLTRLRDQLPTTQLVMERAQEVLDTLNEHWFAKYLDEQQDLLQLIEDYANGQQFNGALLHEATKPLTAEEQQLETGRFWIEAGNWDEAAKVMGREELEDNFPHLVRDHRERELLQELLNAKALDVCDRSRKTVVAVETETEQPPEYLRDKPRELRQDRRRWKGFGGLGD